MNTMVLPVDAIHHALAAEDFERAADLVELTLANPNPELPIHHSHWLDAGVTRAADPRQAGA